MVTAKIRSTLPLRKGKRAGEDNDASGDTSQLHTKSPDMSTASSSEKDVSGAVSPVAPGNNSVDVPEAKTADAPSPSNSSESPPKDSSTTKAPGKADESASAPTMSSEKEREKIDHVAAISLELEQFKSVTLQVNATQIPFFLPFVKKRLCGLRCNNNDATMKDAIVSFINSALGDEFEELVTHKDSPVNQSLMEAILFSLEGMVDDIKAVENEVCLSFVCFVSYKNIFAS